MIKSVSINGLRGFSTEQMISFAIPEENKPGSGLTIMVGANNSGKTTILEALKAFNSEDSPTFSEGKRNKNTEDRVTLSLTTKDSVSSDEILSTITTISEGGSGTTRTGERYNTDVVQSRRHFDFQFSKNHTTKDSYIRQQTFSNRSGTINDFSSRLFRIQKNRSVFDPLLEKILGSKMNWTIEQSDSGNYYIKYTKNGCTHNSEGIGDGIWSAFTICGALYDSVQGDIIAIDEPELSLHPAIQKRLMKVLIDYAKDRQIIISTHSPSFIDWRSIINGAALIRTVKDSDGNINIYSISDKSRANIGGFLDNLHQPHTLGQDANEIFFLEDKVILLEGQEDVIMYQKMQTEIKTDFHGTFFGWGVGGAGNMEKILRIMQDLGYKHVACIYDGDQTEKMIKDEGNFPGYKFKAISTDDVRDKISKNGEHNKIGLVTEDGTLKEEYRDEVSKLIEDINGYLDGK